MDAQSRRQMLRERILKQEALVLPIFLKKPSFLKENIDEPEKIISDHEMEGSSESSEYTSGSESEAMPLLKPVFVPRNNRITIQQDEEQLEQLHQLKFEEEAVKRRHETKEIIAQLIMEDTVKENNVEGEENVVITDDDDEETAYEEWKIRELKRMTRNSEEAETFETEKREIQRLRLMTEEERQAHLAANPKFITNQAEKGEYKFLQKYYHRGAFYLDKDEDVLKQNFAQPTLEDHFDKSTLPQVMRVKNFGKASRTKYTHLVDQDTSCFEGAWSKKNELSGIFSTKIGGGMKQTFDRPATKRKKYN
uniref:Microfibrillar-associated protein 1 (Trinotate prediction) n=1 Tax=Myxobolus squamalis TaxID=59785 RepID=A0A6B2G696_MYXSQ